MPSAPALGPKPKSTYAILFQAPWLTLETITEPDWHRNRPHTALITAAFSMKTGTWERVGSKPVLSITADQCHSENATLLQISMSAFPSPTRSNEVHRQPRKKPSL
jgi:hypothetical protein